jgi:hypothetical protein
MKWLTRLARWFRLVVDARPPWGSKRVDDVPDTVELETVYIVGEGRAPWSAVFVCPCGCQEVISLSLIGDDHPRWRSRLHLDGTVTLSPSIWRKRGCRSHFFIRRGKIVWAALAALHRP